MSNDNTDLRLLFINESSLQSHITAFQKYSYEYMSTLLLLFKHHVNLTIITKARVLVASFYNHNKQFIQLLLSMIEYSLPEIVKTCEILDSKRNANQIVKKMDKIWNAKNKKYKKLKQKLTLANTINEGVNISLNKSKIKFLKNNWVKKIPK